MDGYAVRAADTPGSLPVAFQVAAGAPSQEPLPAGACAAISTGGALPAGADAVVPLEQTGLVDGAVVVGSRVEPGEHVRPPGEDVAAGAVVLRAGSRLGSAQVGALAAAGVAEVVCHARPRVSVLATGSELREPGTSLRYGEIYESNRAIVATALASAGADVELLPVVADDPRALREALRRGLEGEVLVTSGGVSVGPHDLVRALERDLGVEEVFWGVAMKPGKPLSFGVRGSTLVFGLPGNPVSALVGTMVFVLPAVRALQGALAPGPAYDFGTLATPTRRKPERDEFVRARCQRGGDEVLLEPVVGQESHMIVRAAAADALVHVPRGDGEIPAGARVRYLALA